MIEQLSTIFKEEGKHNAPKYIQLSNTFKALIRLGVLKAEDRMPSFNELIVDLDVSKDTIEKAYKILKEEHYIVSVRGKGTFVMNSPELGKIKVLLIFNKMSVSKKKLYESFTKTSEDHIETNLLLHDGNLSHLEKIIQEQKNNYHYFVIIPIFKKVSDQEVQKVLKLIPSNQLLLLGRAESNLSEEIPSVYEDFSEDIFNTLQQNIKPIVQFDQLHLVIAKDSSRSLQDIWSGFVRFCLHFNLSYKVSSNFNEGDIENNTLYIVTIDEDLANIIKDCRTNNWQLGKDIGLISYNDSPLKEILEGGITIITSSFKDMGKIAASQIINKKLESVKVPFVMKRRASL
ncbi:GntR family transcriptional regulator [Flammeovirga yaeyamensis]|uniref:GntR family transcriptional regulator n=1 Tax=Flammeovirga yaeyamensis TaxID=367791 RepID=A0AAX1N932_9BACT|nr:MULTISPECIES: GntR family transcriptional regulator [Flammeovirga]ANQ51801.1 GntR family transcriptional regulator [Flammeovirga sp. MY04]MBB3699532.1 DNA-binding transcriptional regulator YhcF (GntR family) [Flammeovirga yaeyamensis]NMF35212.1 GntR family transcriptional regulator [Flammeovirga yaeyamensis]QWG04074.1 GntR family transcriptional regulator [Flammeovirga yaeyamensis]